MVFPKNDVLSKANQGMNHYGYVAARLPKSTPQRSENSVIEKGGLKKIFTHYKTVVKPLINGKYTSKEQIENALKIIRKYLHRNFSDCFPIIYEDPMIEMVGSVGIDVIKHTIDSFEQETTRSWSKPLSKDDICTFWDGESNKNINPSPVVKKLLGIPIPPDLTQFPPEIEALDGDMSRYDNAFEHGGKRTRKYKCKNRKRSKHRVRLSKRSNN
jgi:hypothetical protein